MVDEYMILKIREWARNGVISQGYEEERLVAFGVGTKAAIVMAAEDAVQALKALKKER